jgi:hypothetical protein
MLNSYAVKEVKNLSRGRQFRAYKIEGTAIAFSFSYEPENDRLRQCRLFNSWKHTGGRYRPGNGRPSVGRPGFFCPGTTY